MVQITARKKSNATHHHVPLGHRGVNLYLVQLLVVEEQKFLNPRAHLVMVITSILL